MSHFWSPARQKVWRRDQARKERESEPSTSPEVKQAVSSGISGLVSSFNQAQGGAEAANESRYQRLIQLATKDFQQRGVVNRRQLDVIGQETGQRAADIRSEGAEEESNVAQRLRQLGMSGTTITPTLREGTRKGTSEKLNRLSDAFLGRKLGVYQQIAAQDRAPTLGIMERRTDAYPDQSMLANLVSSIGTGQKGDLLPSVFSGLSGTTSSGGGGAPAGANSSLSAAQYRSKYGA